MADVNLKRVRERFDSIPVSRVGTCLVWGGPTNTGYGSLCVDGETFGAHRLAWSFTYGKIPPGMCICHKCDNCLCVEPKHLFLGTRADNNHDMKAKGRGKAVALIGEYGPTARLTDQQVAEIRRRHAHGETKAELARAFKLSWGYVQELVALRARKAPSGIELLCNTPDRPRRCQRGPQRNQFEPGEAHRNATITDREVALIRCKRAGGHSAVALAEEFGISQSYTRKLITGYRLPIRSTLPTPAARAGDDERSSRWGTNAGHGHVWERPDGVRMRCGGPAMCRECALDAAAAKGRKR